MDGNSLVKRFGLDDSTLVLETEDVTLENKIPAEFKYPIDDEESYRRIRDLSVEPRMPLSNYQLPMGKVIGIPLVSLGLLFGAYNLKDNFKSFELDNTEVRSLVNVVGHKIADLVYLVSTPINENDSKSVFYDLPKR